MYNRYIRRDDGTYTKVAEPEPPRQETADHGSQPPPPPPDDPNESSPRSGGPPPSFGGTVDFININTVPDLRQVRFCSGQQLLPVRVFQMMGVRQGPQRFSGV